MVERRLEQAAEAPEPRLPAAGRSGTKADAYRDVGGRAASGTKAERSPGWTYSELPWKRLVINFSNMPQWRYYQSHGSTAVP